MSSEKRSISQERPEDTTSSGAGVVRGIVRNSLVMSISQGKAKKHQLMKRKHEEERLKIGTRSCQRETESLTLILDLISHSVLDPCHCGLDP